MSSAQWDDPGAKAIALLIPTTAWVSLAAVLDAVRGAGTLEGPERLAGILLALAALCTAWLVIQTSVAFHYARLYYRVDVSGTVTGSGLQFPGGRSPCYSDFLYHAMVVGMTSQVSDVQVISSAMRRFTLLHSIAAFAFNVLVLATAINALATALPALSL